MLLKHVIIFLLSIVAIVACTATDEDSLITNATEGAVTREAVEALAPVSSAELNILESFPVQVQLRVSGQFSNDCTTITRVDQARGGNTFAVEVILLSPSPPNATCVSVPTEYEQIVELDVLGLFAGTYNVNVNGVIQSFTLTADNMLQEPVTMPTEENPDMVLDTYTLTGQIWHDICAIAEQSANTIEASAGCTTSATGIVANGILEAGEPPLVGVQVAIGLGACPGGDPFAMTVSDDAGNYTFSDLRPSEYCVTVPIVAEPNATILVPGEWTAPNVNGQQTITITASEPTVAEPFGWDYKFLPNPSEVDFEAIEDDALVVNNPGCIHLAAFDGDITIPDDSPFEPGTSVQKIWRFVNTGGCSWGNGYALRFVDGDLMGASTTVPIRETVLPGEAIHIAVDMITPQEQGEYQGNWMFSTPDNELFGIGGDDMPVWVRLKVVEANTLGSITGFLWDDLCDSTGYEYGVSALPAGCFLNENGTIRGDGVYDSATEPPIANVLMEIGTGECGDAEPLGTARTDENGNYRFGSLSPGIYCVYVEVLTESNFPILVPGDFTAPTPSRAGSTVELALNQDVDSIDFGWDRIEVSTE